MKPILFVVYGIPRPGGSKRAFVLRRKDSSFVTRPGGSPIVNIVDDAKGNKEWRTAVGWYARKAYVGEPLTCALYVKVTFYLPRAKGHFGTGRNATMLRPSAPRFPTTKPDATKLWRSTEDALTHVLWKDDCQLVGQKVLKRYAGVGTPCGARIEVYAADDVLTLNCAHVSEQTLEQSCQTE